MPLPVFGSAKAGPAFLCAVVLSSRGMNDTAQSDLLEQSGLLLVYCQNTESYVY